MVRNTSVTRGPNKHNTSVTHSPNKRNTTVTRSPSKCNTSHERDPQSEEAQHERDPRSEEAQHERDPRSEEAQHERGAEWERLGRRWSSLSIHGSTGGGDEGSSGDGDAEDPPDGVNGCDPETRCRRQAWSRARASHLDCAHAEPLVGSAMCCTASAASSMARWMHLHSLSACFASCHP